MTTNIITKNVNTLILLSTVALFALGTTQAEARERTHAARDSGHSVTWNGKNGASGSATQSSTRERGSVTRQTDWQNNRGTGSSDSTRTYNKETSSVVGSRITTNAQGKTATTTSVGTKTDTGYNNTSTHTGYNGNTITSSKDISKTDEGYDVNRTMTTGSGKTVSTDGSVSRTDNGYDKTGTYTTGAGNSGDYYKNFSRTADGHIVNSGATNQDGKTVSKAETMTRGNGVWAKDTTRIGTDGVNRTTSVGGTYSRTTNP